MNEIPAGEVRARLERILESDGFRDAGRLGPFLKYVVEAALVGRPVKEAVLGSEVFGRAANYDSKTDPIVRVEARRLRARLEDFYQKHPQEDVRIELPKGGYLPTFTRVADGARQDVPPVATRRFAGPALVLAVIVFCGAGISWLFWARGRAMNSPVPAIALLPFQNATGDPANDYFSDGLTGELIDALAKVEQLRVVSFNSAARFRGKAGNLEELRNQLHAGSVLDGSVKAYGDRLSVTARLVDTNSGQTIWSDTYERPAKDVFQVQEAIAKSIVYSLKVQLRVDPERILVPPRTESQTAYDDYLRARYVLHPFSKEGLLKSNEYAQKSVTEDAKYGPSYAVLAENYTLLGYYQAIPLKEAAAKVEDLARKAIELDPSSGEAHAALGIALGLADWDWKGAQLELNRAVQWAPGSPDAHSAMALAYLAPAGQLEAAEYEAHKAVDLDPFSFVANDVAGYILLARGKPQEAIERYSAALGIYSGIAAVHSAYAMALAAAGRKDEARAEFIKACDLSGGAAACSPGPVGYAVLGEADQSRALLEKESPSPVEEARARAVLGDRELAFKALEKAIDQRDPQAVFLQVDSRFSSLRADPGFGALLKRLNLTQ
ncbi:MAG TPA: tetratricopeptide repeat protein [Bryobacteraceae bacterium]|jgi:serine/threonine-protein kinase